MATVARLYGTVGYEVENAEGAIGEVEEIWLGPRDEPEAVAVRTKDGSRGLLLDEHVLAVDREHHWVVVGEHPDLLELDAPRLRRDGDGRHLAAVWETTGAVIHPEPPSRFLELHLHDHLPSAIPEQKPLWKTVGVLYSVIGLIVVLAIALVLLVSWAVGGAPY